MLRKNEIPRYPKKYGLEQSALFKITKIWHVKGWKFVLDKNPIWFGHERWAPESKISSCACEPYLNTFNSKDRFLVIIFDDQAYVWKKV